MDETGDWVPPEDEYDALNDETFGDDSGTGMYKSDMFSYVIM